MRFTMRWSTWTSRATLSPWAPRSTTRRSAPSVAMVPSPPRTRPTFAAASTKSATASKAFRGAITCCRIARPPERVITVSISKPSRARCVDVWNMISKPMVLVRIAIPTKSRRSTFIARVFGRCLPLPKPKRNSALLAPAAWSVACQLRLLGRSYGRQLGAHDGFEIGGAGAGQRDVEPEHGRASVRVFVRELPHGRKILPIDGGNRERRQGEDTHRGVLVQEQRAQRMVAHEIAQRPAGLRPVEVDVLAHVLLAQQERTHHLEAFTKRQRQARGERSGRGRLVLLREGDLRPLADRRCFRRRGRALAGRLGGLFGGGAFLFRLRAFHSVGPCGCAGIRSFQAGAIGK